MEMMATFPLTAPPLVGANCTLKVALCPAVSVKGKVRPLRLTPVPVAVAAEIVRLELPELVRVSFKVFVFPTTTFPNVKLVGLGVI